MMTQPMNTMGLAYVNYDWSYFYGFGFFAYPLRAESHGLFRQNRIVLRKAGSGEPAFFCKDGLVIMSGQSFISEVKCSIEGALIGRGGFYDYRYEAECTAHSSGKPGN